MVFQHLRVKFCSQKPSSKSQRRELQTRPTVTTLHILRSPLIKPRAGNPKELDSTIMAFLKQLQLATSCANLFESIHSCFSKYLKTEFHRRTTNASPTSQRLSPAGSTRTTRTPHSSSKTFKMVTTNTRMNSLPLKGYFADKIQGGRANL